MKSKIYPKEESVPKLTVLKGLAYTLPIVYYINELTIPGDIRSCYTTSVNQYALDFIGSTRAQLNGMGIHIFKEIVHPEDLALLRLGLKTTYPAGSDRTVNTTIRLKPYGEINYRVLRCSKTVLETFDDGSVKKMMVGATDITNLPLPLHPKAPPPKEPGRLKYRSAYSQLTNREKEILRLIVNGMSSTDISDKFQISINTIKKHRSRLIKKTETKSMAALVAIAVKNWGY